MTTATAGPSPSAPASPIPPEDPSPYFVSTHVIHCVPLSYEPGLRSVIFRLGMYAVAGIYLGRVGNLPLVVLIGTTALRLAVAAFLATLTAMLWHLWVTLVRPAR